MYGGVRARRTRYAASIVRAHTVKYFSLSLLFLSLSCSQKLSTPLYTYTVHPATFSDHPRSPPALLPLFSPAAVLSRWHLSRIAFG